MAYPFFLRLGCLDLIGPQATAYARSCQIDPATGKRTGIAFPYSVLDCCDCDGLDRFLDYPGGWTDPVTDDAPWYDITEPESPNFGGLLITSVSGLGPGSVTRSVNQIASGGAVLGRRRQAAPTVVVTGILVGGSCCAVAYGHRWLRAALEGECEQQTGCPGQDLTYLNCCPKLPATATDAQIDAAFRAELRTMKGVALVGDVEIISERGRSCGCGFCPLTTVQFQLAGTQPCVFRDPVEVVTDHRLRDGSPLIQNCFEWVKPAADGSCPGSQDCAPPPACTINPICPTPTPPPQPPVVFDNCLSCTPFEQYKTCTQIPADAFPAWTSAALSYRIFAGSQELKHVRITLWQNPLNLPVDELDPCAACSEINLSYVRPFGTFTIDSANRKTVVSCPGASDVDGASFLGGPPGQLFGWPELECGGINYTVCVEVQGTFPTPAPSAAIYVTVTAKEC